jgi:hypothetical protein
MAKNTILDQKPNVPSFDFDIETGKPNLAAGERVVRVAEEAGIPVYTTDAGRVIYVTSLDEFQAKIHGLYQQFIWAHYYPQATGKVRKFKADTALLNAVGKAVKVVPTEVTAGNAGAGE